jgi:hypothetical protein
MSGVFKSIGKAFKAVGEGIADIGKGIWKVTKQIWKPALIAAAAYFTIGVASNSFGSGELAASMPGFGEEGIFTKMSNFMGFGSGAGMGESAATSFAVPDTPQATALPESGLSDTPLMMQSAAGKSPSILESLGLVTPKAVPTAVSAPTATASTSSGGILGTLGKIPLGAYVVGGQLISGMGQGAAQEEQLAEQRRQFDESLANNQNQFNQSRQFAGSFYGLNNNGNGAPIQIQRPDIPQIKAPLVQAQQVPQLSVDDLLKLQQAGIIS